jgi:hypothetical protein
MRCFVALLVLASLFLAPAVLRASDHADPALPAEFDPSLVKEPNITGLFVFPEGDQLVLIFNVFRSLSAPPPYQLEDYEYVLYLDLHSKIDYSDEQIRARYGGHVVHPEGISPDATITVSISNQATLADKKVEGLKNPEAIRWYVGVRDDPFIFTPFFGVNVVSMVMQIPLSSFPEGQQDWILWGVTRKKGEGEILDHIGRGLRTQLPRFGFINTLPPSQHAQAIEKAAHASDGFRKFLTRFVAPATNLYDDTFAIRYYDGEPDVCIYTSRYPALFPNGRKLEDDIAYICCQFGDCILQELAVSVGKIWPRPTVNDKPLSPEFPYLAEPWPEKPPAPQKGISPQLVIRLVIALAILLVLLNFYFLWRGWRCCKKLKAAGL